MFCKYCGAKLIQNDQEILCKKCKRTYHPAEADFFLWDFKEEHRETDEIMGQKFHDEEQKIRTDNKKDREHMEKTRKKTKNSRIIILLFALCIVLLAVGTILSQIQLFTLKQQYKNLQKENQQQLYQLEKKMNDLNDTIDQQIEELESEMNQYEQKLPTWNDTSSDDDDDEITDNYDQETEEAIAPYTSQTGNEERFTENQTEGDSDESNR